MKQFLSVILCVALAVTTLFSVMALPVTAATDGDDCMVTRDSVAFAVISEAPLTTTTMTTTTTTIATATTTEPTTRPTNIVYESDFTYSILNNGTVVITEFDGWEVTMVTIPETLGGFPIARIGDSAFYGCRQILEVKIPQGVVSIDDFAFSNCDGMRDMWIPDSVTSIGDCAFYNCADLETVYYSGSREDWDSIEMGYNNEDVTSATIHFNVKSDHWELKTMLVEPTCKHDGKATYTCPCGYSKTVVLPALGDHIYEDGKCIRCPMEIVESPHDYPNNYDNTWTIYKEGAVSITVTFSENNFIGTGDYFIVCDDEDNEIAYSSGYGGGFAGETFTVLGDTVKIRLVTDDRWTAYGFAVSDIQVSYKRFTYALLDDTSVCITSYLAKDTDAVVPETIDGYTVTAIGNSAFCDKRIQTLTLPRTVTTIGEKAFDKCDALTTVYYGGNEEEWAAMTVGEFNYRLLTATVHYAQAEDDSTKGDYDKNGILNMMDALNLYNTVSLGTFPSEKTSTMDMNGDGLVNMMDALLLYRAIS